jgi:hypothetical protein
VQTPQDGDLVPIQEESDDLVPFDFFGFGQHAPGVVFGQSIPNGHEEDGPISKVVGIWPVEQTNVICGERKDEDLVLSGNITLKNSYVIVECPRVAAGVQYNT